MPSTNRTGGGGREPVEAGRRDSNSRAGVVIRLPIRFKGGGCQGGDGGGATRQRQGDRRKIGIK